MKRINIGVIFFLSGDQGLLNILTLTMLVYMFGIILVLGLLNIGKVNDLIPVPCVVFIKSITTHYILQDCELSNPLIQFTLRTLWHSRQSVHTLGYLEKNIMHKIIANNSSNSSHFGLRILQCVIRLINMCGLNMIGANVPGASASSQDKKGV